jgi:hypothetical protein
MSVLEHALKLAAAGKAVFPCDPADKSPLVASKTKGAGGLKLASKDAAQIRDWWTVSPRAMIGMPCGSANGFFVLDFDLLDKKTGELADLADALKELESAIGCSLPMTLTANTPSGGTHFYFQMPHDDGTIGNRTNILKKKGGAKIDVRGNGGYVCVPGSVNSEGKAYRWNGRWFAGMWDMLALAPEALVTFIRKSGQPAPGIGAQAAAKVRSPAETGIRKYGDAALEKELRDLANAVPGGRNDALNKATFSLAQLVAGGALDETTVRAQLEAAALNIGLDIGEVRKTIDSGIASGLKQPRTFARVRVASGDNSNVADFKAEKTKREKRPPQPPHSDDELLQRMNEDFAVVQVGGKVRVMTLEASAQYPGLRLPVYWSFPDFKNFYHRVIGSGRNAMPQGAWWLAQPDRRQYRGVIYAPNQVVHDYYNLCQGFAIEPKAGDCELYDNHTLEVICSGNEQYYNYLNDWMAYTVQHPDKPGRIVIVMCGGEGAGKGICVAPFQVFFGPHYRLADKSTHLVGKFNAHLQACSFLFADEATFAGDRSTDGALKSLVTSPTLTIEPKGFEQISVPNSLHIMMASNSDWVVPAGPDARRYFVLAVSDHRRGDHAYFSAIRHQMQHGGNAALLDKLLKRDISDFDPERDMPATAALETQKAYSRRGIDALIDHITDDGVLPCALTQFPWIVSTSGELKNPPAGFYAAARRIAPDLKRMHSRTIKRELIENWGCENWRSNGRNGLKFPALSDLRAKFDAKNKMQTNWSMPNEWTLEGDEQPDEET